jgi:tetratricopeptide (TPR) repeat protein
MELGNEQEAEMAVAEAFARATGDDDRIDLAYALRASLRLAIRQHRSDDARHTFEQALDLARRMNYPYGQADYLTTYGIMCKERGAIEEARQWLQEALSIFLRLGAQKDVERVTTAVDELNTIIRAQLHRHGTA